MYEFDIEALKEESQEAKEEGDERNEVVLQTEKLIGEIRNMTSVQGNQSENKAAEVNASEVKENLIDIVDKRIKKRYPRTLNVCGLAARFMS